MPGPADFTFFFFSGETRLNHVSQAGRKRMASRNLHASASQSAAITGMSYHFGEMNDLFDNDL